jgi:HSP20 family protein
MATEKVHKGPVRPDEPVLSSSSATQTGGKEGETKTMSENTQIVKHTPTNPIARRERIRPHGLTPFGLLDEMNDVFDDLFNTDLFFTSRQAMPLSAVSQRSHTVRADDEKMEISVDLPGVKLSDLDVSIQGNEVTVQAKRGDRLQAYSWLVRQDYDSANPKAHLEDGVLTLTFAKKPEAKSRKIEVTVTQK